MVHRFFLILFISVITSCSSSSENKSDSKEEITDVQISDKSDNGNGSDLFVTFTRLKNENDLIEYRIIVLETSNTQDLNLTDVQTLESGRYSIVGKESNMAEINLSEISVSAKNGVQLQNYTNYQILVHAVYSNSENDILSTISKQHR